MASIIQIKNGTGSASPSSLQQGELAINVDNGKLFYGTSGSSNSVSSSFTFNNLTVNNLTTTNLTSSIITASTIETSGSNIFGNSADDTHTFIGDITASNNISASGTITANSFTGNGLSIDGSSNSHIEVGEYNVGYDFAASNTLYITGSGLIISGAMADANHHNMLKIGNVELLDLNTAVSTNEFLIHNVNSFKITSGSDGGDVANDTNNIFVHNGNEFFLCKGGETTANATIKSTGTTTTLTDTNIAINASNGPSMRALNSTNSTHIAGFSGNPHSNATQQVQSILASNFFPLVNGAVTASAVSASGDLSITGKSFFGGHITASGNISSSGTIIAGTLDAAAVSDTLAAAIVAEIDNDEIPIAKLAEDSISGVALGSNLNNLTVDNATLQLDSGTTYNGSAARTISIKDGGVDTDALADDITVAGDLTVAADIIHSGDTDTKIRFVTDAVRVDAGGTAVFNSSTTGSVLPMVHQNVYDTGSLALNANSAFGDIVKFGGSSTVAGGIYFLNSSGGWTLTQANAAATSTGSLAVAVGTNSTTHGMCLRGFVNPHTDPGAGIGAPVYLSDTNTGRMLAAPPSSTNDVVRIVGYQYGTDLIYFNPSNDYIVHA